MTGENASGDRRTAIALVTGASSGIGAAVVRRLAGAGWRVHALARRAGRLEALARETGCVPHAADVRDAAAMERLVAEVAPDLLVNNAGLGAGFSGLAGASREEVARTIDTNVTAVLELSRLVLPGMIARRRGHLVNIGSVAGLYPLVSAVRRARIKDTGIRELSPEDIAGAILYAVSAPPHVNVSTIELQPLEQTFGGVHLDPLDWEERQ
jgi:NADP-dependent 3-hydroxy acid dehydrogenase YdfG